MPELWLYKNIPSIDNFLDTLKILVHFGYDNQAKLLQQKMCKLITLVENEMPEIWKPFETNSQNSEMVRICIKIIVIKFHHINQIYVYLNVCIIQLHSVKKCCVSPKKKKKKRSLCFFCSKIIYFQQFLLITSQYESFTEFLILALVFLSKNLCLI